MLCEVKSLVVASKRVAISHVLAFCSFHMIICPYVCVCVFMSVCIYTHAVIFLKPLYNILYVYVYVSKGL